MPLVQRHFSMFTSLQSKQELQYPRQKFWTFYYYDFHM